MANFSNGTHVANDDTTAITTFQPDSYPKRSNPTERRRQKRSCDQCRRGKRACDAGTAVGVTRQGCTNCRRKHQSCTFHWLSAVTTDRHRDVGRRQSNLSQRSCNSCGATSTVPSQTDAAFDHIENGINCGSLGPETVFNDDGLQHFDGRNGFDIVQDNHENCTPSRRGYSDSTRPARCLEAFRRTSSVSCRSSQSSNDAMSHGWKETRVDLSPLMDRTLGERSARISMTSGLLRIYHDSMENSLSCWLTDHNCPYILTTESRDSAMSEPRNATREWGSSWSNRMYDRVVHLDRAYTSIRSRSLTVNEERMVSKALNMSIGAFASQWAQAGERSTRQPSFPTETGLGIDGIPQSNDFERSMQETLWHQTSQLLHQAASIDSFRVVFALIIFSLTQRPLDITQSTSNATEPRLGYESFQAMVQDDDAPLFLEIAMRQILAHRRKLERLERETVIRENGRHEDPLQEEDRATFNMLYWLGIMFDTLSAAMCQRAVVVEDDDCELPRTNTCSADQHTISKWDQSSVGCTQQFQTGGRNPNSCLNFFDFQAPKEGEIWGDLFIRNGGLRSEFGVTRWPCSYWLAASTLSSAAPVKVLLFRRVSQLQALVSRRASATKIESAIGAAFDVYNHWNRIYNPFFIDCVRQHDNLPTRLQSWYVLLAGHWHLATFLLADLLSTIDSTHLSLPNECASRQRTNPVSMLRHRSALAVADLSRSSIHGSRSEAEDLHFALNQAALLTEPWTVVFVRSLCRAGYFFADIATTELNSLEAEEASRECRDCIEGLWYLGRKSDMAFLAARFLSDMLATMKHDLTVPELSRYASTLLSGYNEGFTGGLDHINLDSEGGYDLSINDKIDDHAGIADFMDVFPSCTIPDKGRDNVFTTWLPESGHLLNSFPSIPLHDVFGLKLVD